MSSSRYRLFRMRATGQSVPTLKTAASLGPHSPTLAAVSVPVSPSTAPTRPGFPASSVSGLPGPAWRMEGIRKTK